jgi:hypothetical protein
MANTTEYKKPKVKKAAAIFGLVGVGMCAA